MLPEGAAKDMPVDVLMGLEFHLSYFGQGVFERNVRLEFEPVQMRAAYFLIEGFAVVCDPSAACAEDEHAFDGLFWTRGSLCVSCRCTRLVPQRVFAAQLC